MERLESLAHDMIEAGDEHFHLARQPTRVLFWTADTRGACEVVSSNWYDSTGQQVNEALDSGWLEIIAPGDRQRVIDIIRSSVALERGFFIQYEIQRADGGQRHVLHDASARFLPSGKFNGLLATITDVSDASSGEAAIEQTAEQVYHFLDDIPLAAIAIDFDGRIVHCNEALSTLLGRAVLDLMGKQWITEHVCLEDRPRVARLIDSESSASSIPSEIEFQIETRSGTHLFRWHLTLIRGTSGHPVSIAMLGSDITRWRRMGNHLRLTAQVFNSSHEAMIICDRNNNIVSVNGAFTKLTGYTSEEIIGKNPRILQSKLHDNDFYKTMWESILEQGYWRGDIWDRRKDGSLYPRYLAVTAIRDESGTVTNYSAIFYDISERKALEDQLDHMAHYDSLTSLPNRMLLQDRLEQAIASSERKQQKLALLFIDLDGFKPINDEYGHAVGDELLKAVSQRLQGSIRAMDTAARLGGDEFVVILTDIQTSDNAALVADKLIELLCAPYTVGEHTLSTTASIGVSIYPNDELIAQELLRTADEAMYRAKREGKRQVRFYSNVK